ncbi:MAG: BNR repeat-containing protein [Actinobacteria bacterium]|nr:BNR repeat-containing protein [Actinomycetota bacterium]
MKPLLVLTLLLALLGVPAAASADAPLPRAADASQLSVLGDGAAWCWFSDPRSVYLRSPRPHTLTAWIDSTGRIVVSSFDHGTRQAAWVTLRTLFAVDDHNNPSLLVHPDGRVSVFWSGHNEGAIWIRTMTRPGDIASFGPSRAITAFAPGDRVVTYTNPILLPGESGRIYLFFRSGYLHQAFITSDDDGLTWSPAVVAVEEPNQWPYVKYDSDGASTIAMAFTDGHPDERKSSVFYSAIRAGQYLHANGSVIKQVVDGPLTPAQGDLLWSAADSGVSGWVHDVALDAAGHPVVVFATIPSPTDHRYHYARYDGTAWKVQQLATAGGAIATNGREPSYSGGITLDHANPSIVYLSRPAADPAVDEIERWRTPDAGASWVAEAITSASTETNVRPVRPRGLPSDAQMQAIWMSGPYPYFTSFRTSLFGSAAIDRGTAAPTLMRVSASSLAVVPGSPVSLRARLLDAGGSVLPAAEVTLVQRPAGATVWRRVAEDRTDQDGMVRFDVWPLAGTEYQVLWPGDDLLAPSSSPAVQVQVVRPTAVRTSVPAAPIPVGGVLALSARLVSVAGGVGGRTVTLVGRRPGALGWTTLMTARTGPDGLVVFRRLLMQPTVYAVRFAGDGLNLPSTSANVVLTPVRGS